MPVQYKNFVDPDQPGRAVSVTDRNAGPFFVALLTLLTNPNFRITATQKGLSNADLKKLASACNVTPHFFKLVHQRFQEAQITTEADAVANFFAGLTESAQYTGGDCPNTIGPIVKLASRGCQG